MVKGTQQLAGIADQISGAAEDKPQADGRRGFCGWRRARRASWRTERDVASGLEDYHRWYLAGRGNREAVRFPPLHALLAWSDHALEEMLLVSAC